MIKFRQLFKNANRPAIIGMVHVGALPGAPLFENNLNQIVTKALHETEIYLNNQLDGILVENMHDVPYVKSEHFTPETVAVMTRVCTEIDKITPKGVPKGVQVLAGGNFEALAVAQASNFNFIRAEGFVFGHVADEGYIDANAGLVLRYRKRIDAENVLIFTDIKKKHSSHAITSDVSLVETVKAAEFFLSDGVIITGGATGHAADVSEVSEVVESTKLPVLVGSGVNSDNFRQYGKVGAFIVGSDFKRGGQWFNEVDSDRVGLFMRHVGKI